MLVNTMSGTAEGMKEGASGENPPPISPLGQKDTVLNIIHGKSHMWSSSLHRAKPCIYSESEPC